MAPINIPGGMAVNCTTDSDCGSDGGYPAMHCLRHICGYDQCLADTDCPSNSVCGCSSQFGGNILHTNICVPSSCHVDADCASGFCSPANNNRCGSLTGYHCRGPADGCEVESDCLHPGGGAPPSAMTCQYAPEVSHWQCAPIIVCNG